MDVIPVGGLAIALHEKDGDCDQSEGENVVPADGLAEIGHGYDAERNQGNDFLQGT